MILNDIEKIVSKPAEDKTIRPRYNGYSLVNIPNTAMKILNPESALPGLPLDRSITDRIEISGIRKVILILVDGLGYDMFLDSYKDSPFFNALVEKGIVTPLTSGFPSTTAASVTTVNTGLTPQEHAVPEWTLYFREVDNIIKPLPMVTIDEKREPLKKIIENPKLIYKGDTLYRKMAEAGIRSCIVQNSYFIHSTYNKLLNEGGSMIPYTTNSDMALQVKKAAETMTGGYIHGYTDSVDYTTHVYGPKTEESSSEIVNIGNTLQQNLLNKIKKETAKDTLLMITADHGHIKVDPEKIIYLDNDKKLTDAYEIGPNNKPILPSGFPRDVFLHIKENKLEEIKEYLLKEFEGRATVIETKKAFEIGIFGVGRPEERFFDRVGNLILLPKDNGQIWYSREWYEYIKGSKPHLLGMHGGLSRDEVLIPLAMARLSDLI